MTLVQEWLGKLVPPLADLRGVMVSARERLLAMKARLPEFGPQIDAQIAELDAKIATLDADTSSDNLSAMAGVLANELMHGPYFTDRPKPSDFAG